MNQIAFISESLFLSISLMVPLIDFYSLDYNDVWS